MEIIVKEFKTEPIELNFEELKTQLEKALKKYEGITFTEETMQEGKKTRASLRNLSKAFDEKRKTIKRKILEPYEDFEGKVKELQALIDKPIEQIDRQIKTYEEYVRQEKEEGIKIIYDGLIGELVEELPYDKIFDPKWLNVTTAIKTVEKEIKEIVETTRNDLKVIDSLETEFKVEVKSHYLETLNLSSALQTKTRLEERKKEFAKREKQREIVEIEAKEQKSCEKEVECVAVSKNREYTFNLSITTTIEKKDKLKQFLLENMIKFKTN